MLYHYYINDEPTDFQRFEISLPFFPCPSAPLRASIGCPKRLINYKKNLQNYKIASYVNWFCKGLYNT